MSHKYLAIYKFFLKHKKAVKKTGDSLIVFAEDGTMLCGYIAYSSPDYIYLLNKYAIQKV